MAGFKRFEDIKAWQGARKLTRSINVLAAEPPLSRNFTLKDQLCRASMSIMANIAEGYARSSDKDFAHFLDIARGSAMEVQSHLYVAADLKYISEDRFTALYDQAGEVAAMITNLAKYLRDSHQKRTAK